MQHLEVSGAVRHIYASLGFKGLIKLDFLDRFSKIPNITFNENPSSWSRFVPCGRTGTQTYGRADRQT